MGKAIGLRFSSPQGRGWGEGKGTCAITLTDVTKLSCQCTSALDLIDVFNPMNGRLFQKDLFEQVGSDFKVR